MAREATDGDSPSLGDELDLVVDIIRLYDYVTMNDDDDELRVCDSQHRSLCRKMTTTTMRDWRTRPR